MKTQKPTKSFRLVVDDEFNHKFESIKKFLGLESDSETIRFIVNWYYRNVIVPEISKSKSKLTPEEAEFLRKADAGEIEWTDENVAKMLKLIEEKKVKPDRVFKLDEEIIR